jgi:hypothetical protein
MRCSPEGLGVGFLNSFKWAVLTDTVPFGTGSIVRSLVVIREHGNIV